MAYDVDKGNPNVFKTFQGRFDVETPFGRSRVMLTALNEVCFLEDLNADDEGLLMTLPEKCRPKNTVRFPCVVEQPSARADTVTMARQVGTTRGSVQTGTSSFLSSRYVIDGGLTAEDYDSLSTDIKQMPILSDVDIPVLENVTLNIGSGGASSDFVTVEPEGSVKGTPGAMHRLNGLSFYVLDRYYL